MYFNEEHKQRVINRGDNYTYIGSYRTKEITIDGKCDKSGSMIRVKCPYCGKEYDVRLNSFVNRGDKCFHCCNKYENSFAYHIEVELGENLNKYWNWDKNNKLGINPYYISKSKNDIKVWIKCQEKDYHNDNGGYEVSPNKFHNKRRCPYCHKRKIHPKDSFAQWGINTFGDDFLEKYWSEKNNELGIDPWKISAQSNNKNIYILCQDKDYHNDEGGYITSSSVFYKGIRCSYCCNKKVHPKDSFGALYPEKAKYWSKNNKKSPFEVASHTNDKYNFICEKCGEEFERDLNHLNRNNTGVICRNCTSSQLEQETSKILQKYNIKYISQKEYKGLIGINDGNLSYDFYLPNYNLLIECQGEQHQRYCKGFHKNKEDFERQLEHDRRKKQYSIDHSINFLEIWYYDISDIEEILTKQLNL